MRALQCNFGICNELFFFETCFGYTPTIMNAKILRSKERFMASFMHGTVEDIIFLNIKQGNII